MHCTSCQHDKCASSAMSNWTCKEKRKTISISTPQSFVGRAKRKENVCTTNNSAFFFSSCCSRTFHATLVYSCLFEFCDKVLFYFMLHVYIETHCSTHKIYTLLFMAKTVIFYKVEFVRRLLSSAQEHRDRLDCLVVSLRSKSLKKRVNSPTLCSKRIRICSLLQLIPMVCLYMIRLTPQWVRERQRKRKRRVKRAWNTMQSSSVCVLVM